MSEKIPVISFLKIYANARRILKNPLPFHRENFEKLGDTFLIKVGFGRSSLLTRDRGLTTHILQKQQKKYYKSRLQTEDVAKYMGNGILTSNGEYWLKQRRLIQPAFHKKKLNALIATIEKTIDVELKKTPTNEFVDIYPQMSNMAFQVVAKSLFSVSMYSEMSRLQHITEVAQKMLIKELRQPYKKWWFYFSGQIQKNIELTNEARTILNTIIQDRKSSQESYDDLLDMLLNARYDDGNPMSNKQLIDEILILFTAGHETTANALTFTLALLALHPEIQEKVFQEVKDTEEQQLEALEKLSALSYTRQCIEEAMRLYPPAYITDRVSIEDDEYNGIKLDKGTLVLISFYELHRNGDFWESPDKFNPDRFSADKKKTYSDWYFPFGAGPRMCIGNNFAMYEMILAISETIRRYKVSTNQSSIEIKPLITLRPDNAQLKFEPRTVK
ncbi:cytochrome P450 [Flavobacteriaceae bacterium R38]|nr:cytochrome P450 [Flavobacteriaceae bacterium R38]